MEVLPKIRHVIVVGTSKAVILPANICEQLNIKKGDPFVLHLKDENNIILHRLSEAEIRAFALPDIKL